jgi:hypothetical protein
LKVTTAVASCANSPDDLTWVRRQKVAIGINGAHYVIKIEMAGAAGLEPATFGVTGRTKFNGINGSCNIFFA